MRLQVCQHSTIEHRQLRHHQLSRFCAAGCSCPIGSLASHCLLRWRLLPLLLCLLRRQLCSQCCQIFLGDSQLILNLRQLLLPFVSHCQESNS